jgi:trans-aconitate 2-methyltransferase
MPEWDPRLYLKFGAERSRPALDLAMRAKTLLETAAAPRILDLGCGPGNSTAVLAAIFPGASIVGLDSSPEMIDSAQKSGVEAEWVLRDAASYRPVGLFDLVFSNAALQWIPDQDSLLSRMYGWLKPAGVLAIQVPGNGESPLHRALRRTAADSAWGTRFEGLDDLIRYEEPPFYFEALAPTGAQAEVWESTYWHVLANRQALIDWYSGTGMRPWLERAADEAERQAFKDAVLEAAAPGYPLRADGSLFFPFRRIFVTAVRPR